MRPPGWRFVSSCAFSETRVFFDLTGCVSVSAFASLVSVPVGNINSGTGIKVCEITAGIKK